MCFPRIFWEDGVFIETRSLLDFIIACGGLKYPDVGAWSGSSWEFNSAFLFQWFYAAIRGISFERVIRSIS